MDPFKAQSRGISVDMSPAAIERRLEIVDELRELSLELARAERLGPVITTAATSTPQRTNEVAERGIDS